MGSASTTAGAQLGQQSASNIGNLLAQQGQARASGYAGMNQAVQGTLGNLAGIGMNLANPYNPYAGAFGGGYTGGGGFYNPATIQSIQPYSAQLIANNPGVF